MKTINFLAAMIFAAVMAISFSSTAPASDKHNDCCDDKCLQSSCCTDHGNSAQGSGDNCCTDDCNSQACREACETGKSGASSTDSEKNLNQISKQESVNTDSKTVPVECTTGNAGCCK